FPTVWRWSTFAKRRWRGSFGEQPSRNARSGRAGLPTEAASEASAWRRLVGPPGFEPGTNRLRAGSVRARSHVERQPRTACEASRDTVSMRSGEVHSSHEISKARAITEGLPRGPHLEQYHVAIPYTSPLLEPRER